MQRAFLNMDGVRTSVITFGRWIEESPKSDKEEEIILVIPGNPGITNCYKMFLSILHEKTGKPVWIVGHSGHEIPLNNTISPLPPLKGNEKLYGLKGQTEHKLKFIEEYVPQNAKLHLIGHSIGSYIILDLLKHKSVESKVKSVELLFPTIEAMATSKNGKILLNYVKPILWLILFLSLIFTYLPRFFSNFLMFIYMKIVSIPKMHFTTLMNFIDPLVLEKIFFMAYEEMDQVKVRDDEILKKHLDKIKIVYGIKDGWAPAAYCDNLKRDIPEIDAYAANYEHAFVLRQSREIGNLVAERINKI